MSPREDPRELQYWQPGVSLPSHSTSQAQRGSLFDTTPHRVSSFYTPIRQLQQDTTPNEVDDITDYDGVYELRDHSSGFQSTLEEILQSQKQLQQQMDLLLQRVTNLENSSLTPTSSGSQSDDVKKKKRLPSELCVSLEYYFFFWQQYC